MKSLVRRFILIFTFFISCISCTEINYDSVYQYTRISNNEITVNQITGGIIFFEKNVDDESRIALVSLDMKLIDYYTLPQEGNHPTLLPKQDKVLYIHTIKSDGENHQAIWLFDLKENKTKRITQIVEGNNEVYIFCPNISSDEEKIIVSVSLFEINEIGLALVNFNDGDFRILNTELPMNQCPVFSPNTENIVVTCAQIDRMSGKPGFQLCLLDEFGSFITTITNNGERHHSYYFSPDGKNIIYSEFDIKLFSLRPTDRFYTYNLETGENRLLLEWEVITKGFTSDGESIIFQGRPDHKSPWGIYIINIDGTNLRHLAYFDSFLEDWYSDIEDY